MKSRNLILIFAGISALAAVPGLFAQGFILPGPGLPMPALTDHRVDVQITDQVARVTVHQTFYNPSSFSLEGHYYFPLPPDASITEFEMIADGKTMKGELLEKDKARKIYEDIVRRRIDPALLEYAGNELFSAKIFPIPPRGKREIILEYSGLLRYDGTVVRFSYPLRGELQSGRAGAPARPLVISGMEEGGYEKREEAGAVSQVIHVMIDSKNPIRTLYSPSHQVTITRKNDHHAEASYEGKRQAVSEPFLLYYSYSEKDFGLSMMTFRNGDKEGYFLVLISPKMDVTDEEIMGKEILFILDTSGSMEGEKISQAREALSYCMNRLGPRDRFNIVTFSTEIRFFREEMAPAPQHRKDALEFIRALEAGGGTNINEALLQALGMQFGEEGPRSIVFLTDGLPTVGVTDAGEIVRNVSEKNRAGIKIFTFGVGHDVNTFLLDRIASDSRSVSDYIEPGENIEEKVTQFYDRVSHPVMMDLALDFGGMKTDHVYPKELPDLFRGSQLAVLGRYTGGGAECEVTLKGTVNGREKRFKYDVSVEPDEAYRFIPQLWATRKIGFLSDEIRLHGENAELKDEIIALSLKYGVMSPYTSYLVQEDEAVTDRPPVMPDPGRFVIPPQTVGKDGKLMDAAAPFPVGGVAVQASKAAREMKEAETVSEESGVRHAGGKIFLFAGGYWMDREYRNEKTLDLKAGSDAVVNLMLEYPESAKYLALGDRVVFAVRGKYVRISGEGKESMTREALRSFFG